MDEKGTDVTEHTCIGSRVGTRGAPDGGLVNIDDFVKMLDALNMFVGHGLIQRAVEMLGEDGVEGLVDECGFTTATDSGDDNKLAKGELDINVFEIVTSAAAQ